MSSKDKLVIICGSNGDTGAATAKLLAEKGYTTYGIARSPSKNDFLDKFFEVDLSSKEDLQKIIQTQIQPDQFSSACVINCVGSYEYTETLAYKDSVFSNNFSVADNILTLFTASLLNIENSRIITISSIDAIHPNINSFSYSVSKSAVSTLVKLYKKKFKDFKINFDLILPGAIDTQMRANKKEDKARLISTEDISELCLFLTTRKANCCFDEFIIYPREFSYSN